MVLQEKKCGAYIYIYSVQSNIRDDQNSLLFRFGEETVEQNLKTEKEL